MTFSPPFCLSLYLLLKQVIVILHFEFIQFLAVFAWRGILIQQTHFVTVKRFAKQIGVAT